MTKTVREQAEADASIELLDQCASALARTGGMLNRDLAHDVTAFTSKVKQARAALTQGETK